MRMLAVIALCASSLSAGPAVASAPDAKPAVGDQTVCKKILLTGQRIQRTRVCKTAEEWRLLRERAQDATDEVKLDLITRNGKKY